MNISKLAVIFLVSLAGGCAGQEAQKSSQGQQGLVFSISDESSYTLTPECADKAKIDHDEEGRPMVVVSMKQSPGCSGQAFETIFSKAGQRLTVEYKDQILVEDTLIVTPIDPVLPNWLGVESDAQAHEIVNFLN